MISSQATKTNVFHCSICEEESTRICVNCTKDTCGNHLCAKCACCSDCCGCELSLDPEESPKTVAEMHEPDPEPHPMPDPDPAPEPDPIPTFPLDQAAPINSSNS